MPAFDWGLLIVAGSSLVFAVFATFQILKTKDEVHNTTERANKLMDSAEKSGKKMTSPAFVADVVTRVITGGQKMPDGAPVTVTDIMTGYMNVYIPAIYERLEAKVPEWIPIMMNPASPSGPAGPQNPASEAGRALSNQRWQGGIKAAQSAGKAAKAMGGEGIASKVQAGVEALKAAKEAIPLLKEVRGMVGKGKGSGNGGEDVLGGRQAGDTTDVEWRSPC